MGARWTVSVCGRAASLNRLSAWGSDCRNFSNFTFMGELRVVLLAAFLLGLFIGLKGLLMAAAALVLATDSTTNFDILK